MNDAVTPEGIAAFGGFLFLILLALVGYFFFNLWLEPKKAPLSPYCKSPLRQADALHWMTKEKILRYLIERGGYENRMFEFERASYCRETGRIFVDSVRISGQIDVDWSFIQKRHPGKFVSWGSLSSDHQREIMEKHGSMEAFQTQFSSPDPAPSHVDQMYASMRPGPLYVDPDTHVLVGWQCVPDCDMEVLIVQKPKR